MRFHVADSLTGRLVGQLRPSRWSITEPVTGNTQGTLTVAVPRSADATAALRDLTTPRIRQIIAEDTIDGRPAYWFAGPVTQTPTWNVGEGTITVTVADWRWWFSTQAVLRPGALGSGSTDYIVTNTEQATAMHALMKAALTDPSLTNGGLPHMVVDDAPTTGITRDVTVRMINRYIGEELDSIRDRNGDGSTDWYTYTTRVDDQHFMAHVAVAWPQRNSSDAPVTRVQVSTHGDTPEADLRLRVAPGGSRVSAYTWPEGQPLPTRVYALGEGTPPDMTWASDDDPDLGDGTELLCENIAGPYTGVVKKKTAFKDAHSIVGQTGQLTGQATVDVPADALPVGSMVAGDRARLDLTDDWLDVHLDAVRISQRTVSSSSDQAVSQELTLDLADPVPLPVDNPGVVGDGS